MTGEMAQHAPVQVRAAPGSCSLQFDPIGRQRFVKSCDIAKGPRSLPDELVSAARRP